MLSPGAHFINPTVSVNLSRQMIKLLAKNKLIKHQSKPYDGYRLTSKGYDYLALKSLAKRGTLKSLGIQVCTLPPSRALWSTDLHTRLCALHLASFGRRMRLLVAQIGVGKESDIFTVATEEGVEVSPPRILTKPEPAVWART